MKKVIKKTLKKQEEKNINIKKVIKDKIHEDIDKLKKVLNTVKLKYNNMDSETKKNIISGVLGSAALIAGIIGASKINKNLKQKKAKNNKK